MPAPDETKTLTDHAAVALSLLCIAHCLALPLLAVSLPFAAAAADAEWLHWTFAALAVVASGSVVLTASSARVPAFMVPAGLGAVLVVGGVFAENFGLDETIPTVIGGVLLAAAHGRRIFSHAA